VRAQDLYHVVAVELDATLVAREQASSGTTRVSIRCRQTVADIAVLDPTTGKTLERSIDLRAAPKPGRARLLGLAAVELVSASWAELEAEPSTAARSVGAQASPAEQTAARLAAGRRKERELDQSRRSLRLALMPQVTVPLSDAPLLAGGTMKLASAAPGLGWALEGALARASISEELGHISLVSASAGAGLGYRADLGAWWVTGELGARLGSSFWQGAASEPKLVQGHSYSANFSSVRLAASVDYELSELASLVLLLSAEQVIMPVYVRSAGRREHGLYGTWLGAGLGSSFAF